MRLKVKGRGRFAGRGELRQIDTVRELEFSFEDGSTLSPPSMSFSDTIDTLISEVPESEWQRIPSDLSVRIDDYLYGPPKK